MDFGPVLGGLISGVANLFGGKMSSDAVRDSNEKNAAMQREFAQQGVRWRVEDAKAAGIHPLYALGASGAAASPSYQVDSGTATGVANMGQDISRAIHATRTADERQFAVLNLRRADLENQLLESQIHNLQQSQFGPPMPSATDQPLGGINSGGAVQVQPQRPSASSASIPQMDAGAIADYGLVRTATGYAVVPSKDAKERIEDQAVPEAMWAFRNLLKPLLTGHQTLSPKEYPLPRGFTAWVWNPSAQEFQPGHGGKIPWSIEAAKRQGASTGKGPDFFGIGKFSRRHRE